MKDYEVVRQGLIAETDILKRLNHPHLPSIIDVIDREDTFLIVMDYIEGKALDYWLKKEGAQPQERVVEWAKQICDVFGYLHSRKPPIIYRDLKPANVMLKPDGQIMIIDFGTAREFKETSIEDTSCLGTQGYAAPEQYGGHGQTDARTDIYTLGATMYHLLTGHNPSLPPYEMYPIRRWNPALSSGLEEIVLKVGETMTTKSSYEGYIKEAANSPEQSEREKYYTDAIKIDPRRGEAYHNLLQLCIRGADGSENDFDREETARLTSVLGYKGSGNRTNESYFEGNKEEYDEFAFQMGLAYFYSYEGGEKSGKSMSQTWFEKAAESESLDKDKKELSKRFASIAAYYASLDSVDESGYSTTSYGDYWIDLVSLTDGDLTSVVNPETALVMYKELVYRIDENALDFKRAGVTKGELLGELEETKKTLETTSFASTNANQTDINEQKKQEILNNISSAKEHVQVAFESRGTGGDADAE